MSWRIVNKMKLWNNKKKKKTTNNLKILLNSRIQMLIPQLKKKNLKRIFRLILIVFKVKTLNRLKIKSSQKKRKILKIFNILSKNIRSHNLKINHKMQRFSLKLLMMKMRVFLFRLLTRKKQIKKLKRSQSQKNLSKKRKKK